MITKIDLLVTLAALLFTSSGLTAPGDIPYEPYRNHYVPGYTFCANEGEYCNFVGMKNIIFGAGYYFAKTIGFNGHNCIGTTFGYNSNYGSDPNYGIRKACYIEDMGYTICALEHNLCNLNMDPRNVAYGAIWFDDGDQMSNFVYKMMGSYNSVDNSFVCDNITFGQDPTPGKLKSCYIGPAGYKFCAYEGYTCNFIGPMNVAYGANGKFAYLPFRFKTSDPPIPTTYIALLYKL